jgi:hypothetical protein
MRKALPYALAALPPALAWAQELPHLLAHQAGEHIGEVAQVCGVIASSRCAQNVRGKPAYAAGLSAKF